MKNNEELLTRRGVCKNLQFSPYTYTVCYKGKVANFNFSSQLHLTNFVNLRKKNYAMIYNYIYKRFKFKIDCTFLSDFNLYRKIETRGCYINFDGKVYTSFDNIILN